MSWEKQTKQKNFLALNTNYINILKVSYIPATLIITTSVKDYPEDTKICRDSTFQYWRDIVFVLNSVVRHTFWGKNNQESFAFRHLVTRTWRWERTRGVGPVQARVTAEVRHRGEAHHCQWVDGEVTERWPPVVLLIMTLRHSLNPTGPCPGRNSTSACLAATYGTSQRHYCCCEF